VNRADKVKESGAFLPTRTRCMNRLRYRWMMPFVIIAAIGLGASVVARAAEPSIPPVLEAWRGWVLDRHPELKCPPRFDNGTIRQCVWMSTLTLELGQAGGRFSADVEVFSDADVNLPGGPDQWPVDVRSTGGSAIVTRLDARPRLHLVPGRYTVSGAFNWTELPDAIPLPRQHGILRLSVDGATIAQPMIDGDRLWLGKAPGAAASEVPSDSLTVRVYRRIDDGVPMMLTTFIDLSVAGSHRIITLGRAMPDGFEPVALDSKLPARLGANGHLEVQVEPGEWQVQLTGRALTEPTSFRASPETANWPADEIWGFNADRALRVVNVEGATPIDLSQTNAPFKDLPAYVVTADNELKLVEQFRGDPSPAPNDFSLARSLWLSFDGSSYTVRDTLDGKIATPTRLAARFVPGRMTVDDTPQLITRLGDAQPGIELPSGTHRVVAVSEMPRDLLDTAVGWETDVATLTGELHLPPGWRLLWTHGVDRAPTAWLPSWTLWDIFLVVISTVLALRLLGRAAAAAVAVTLVLVYQESGAPTLVWILLLLLLAILRIGSGRFGRFARLSYIVVFAFTVIGVLAFAIDGFRMALYPQLENAGYTIYEQAAPATASIAAPMAEQMLIKSADRVERAVVAARDAAVPKPRRQFEANTQVQTGPGVPTWRWRDETLIWDGPVTAAQPIDLVLSPPWLTRSLHVIGPVLLLLLVAIFGGATLPPSTPLPGWLKRMIAPAAAALVALAALAPPDARADIPGPEILRELEQRLTQPPDCLPACAAVERATVKLTGDALAVQLDINAARTVAIPLPAAAQWWPLDARDGDRAATLSRDVAGQLSIVVKEGAHRVELSGPVTHVDRFELPFPLPPGSVSLDLKGWRAYGEQNGHLRGGALQFEREAPASAGRSAASLAPEPIAPYFRLSRTFDFGLEWRIHSTLERIAPQAGSIPFAVPLVTGESLIDGRVRVENGQIIGVLPPDEQQMEWQSALAAADTLQLTGPSLAHWTEQWTLVPSNFWHIDYDGIAPMKLGTDASAGPRFQPLGGETLQIRMTRPVPVPGESITVERVDVTESPGARARRSTLELALLSSQGGNFPIRLPEDARILGIAINGQPQPIPTAAATLPLPVVPGQQQAQITWEAPIASGASIRTSAIGLPGRAYNISLHLNLPTDRWPLFVGGPRLGPAVLYWGVMLVVIGVAWALSRVPALPLSAFDGVLLGFGMSFSNLPSTVLVAAWLIVVLVRLRYTERLKSVSRRTFRLVQVAVAAVSVVALIALAASVPMGLLGAPQMHIAGNNSSAYDYHWFQDQAVNTLPTAYVFSLPMWMYRVVMLAWSLWLAFAVVRWVRWGWAAFSAGGIWRRDGSDVPTPTNG
jgi:hypothetical protein